MKVRRALLIGLTAVAVHAPPQTAEAYCVLDVSWVPNFENMKEIPVWVSTQYGGGVGTSLEFTGIGGDGAGDVADEVRWVKAVIAIINEGAHAAPRLYFAGLDPDAAPKGSPDFWTTRNEGITVSTYGPCENQPSQTLAQQDHQLSKASIQIIRGNEHTCQDNDADKEDFIWWTDPGDDDPMSIPPGIDHEGSEDFVGVLLHEFIHALGLDHTDGSVTCEPDFLPPTTGMGTQETVHSVMYFDVKEFRRRLRRDDVEGLRALWGEPGRRPRWSTATGTNPTPGSWLSPALIPGVTANTPVIMSSASRTNDTIVLAAYTDVDDEIRAMTGAWSGWSGTIAVPSPFATPIRTFDRVAVARGRPVSFFSPERRIVAWHGTDETTCCDPERVEPLDGLNGNPNATRIFWRVHNGSQWRLPRSTGPTRYKEIGAGYDPRTDLFVLAYVDTCAVNIVTDGCVPVPDAPQRQWLFVRTINAFTGGGGCTQALTSAGHVLAVGNVACDFRTQSLPTRCVIPITVPTEQGGPNLRFIEGEITDHDDSVCFVREVEPPTTLDVLALGTPSGAYNTFHTPVTGSRFLGAWNPGFNGTQYAADGWARIYTLNRSALSGWVIPTQQNVRTFTTNTWPISATTLTRTAFPPNIQWRAIFY